MNIFGCLLWIDEKNHSAVNNKNKKITSYFRQLDLLAKTLRSTFGSDLVVMTNDPDSIRNWFERNKKVPPALLRIAAASDVPQGISFYAAHHKLAAVNAALGLLKNDQDRFFLLDADIVARRVFDRQQSTMLAAVDLSVYDISDQVFPTYGAARIRADIETVAGATFTDPRWYGGEWLGGSREGLRHLIEKAHSVMPRYYQNLQSLHHVGDEAYFTAAINLLLKENPALKIVGQSPYYILSRHWSRHTDRSFACHMRHCFVHCPGSKPALELLSHLKNPAQATVYKVLYIYQWLVRLYQFCKKLRTHSR